MKEALAGLYNKISDYMLRHKFIQKGADGLDRMPDHDVYCFQFYVITPNKKKYPVNRAFAVKIVFATTSAGMKYEPPLWRGELATDFGYIHISDTQTDFSEAEAQAITFIDSKVAEVHGNYRTNRRNMAQIYDSSNMPCTGDYIVEEERPGDVMDIVVIPEPVKERKWKTIFRRKKK